MKHISRNRVLSNGTRSPLLHKGQ